MMNEVEAQHFAVDWIEAWNSRDLERVLAHYADRFEMSSPFIARIAGEPSGRLRGRGQGPGSRTAALRRGRQGRVGVGALLMRILCALALAVCSSAHADGYPSRAVKVIVPWPPGQATDIAARIVAQELQQSLGQPFVVENRPGAGGSVGTAVAAKSAPDGYTLLAASSGPMSIMPLLSSLPYDALRDFVMLGLVSRSPYVLAVRPSFAAGDVAEFVAVVKSRPDAHTFASSGTGATGHLLLELFNSMTGIHARHVPYKGAAPALTDVMNGEVDYVMETVAAVAPHVRAGRLKALGVSTARRSASLAQVPSLAEALNLPGFDAGVWIGLAAPAGVAADAVGGLSIALQKALAAMRVQDRLRAAGFDPVQMKPEEMPGFLRMEQERYASVIRSAHITLDP
jgi:tripartite-type tricarboxylate transporter receptor subunit TctC